MWQSSGPFRYWGKPDVRHARRPADPERHFAPADCRHCERFIRLDFGSAWPASIAGGAGAWPERPISRLSMPSMDTVVIHESGGRTKHRMILVRGAQQTIA